MASLPPACLTLRLRLPSELGGEKAQPWYQRCSGIRALPSGVGVASRWTQAQCESGHLGTEALGILAAGVLLKKLASWAGDEALSSTHE